MNRVLRIVLLLSGLTVLGTLGFYYLEDHYSLLDALYMTIITLTTVGYREVQPLSDNGKIFVILFLLVGLGAFLYSLVTLGELIVSTELNRWLEKRKMNTVLKSLKNHFVVCGFGRMGQTVCAQLAAKDLPFVVIDNDELNLEDCTVRNWPCLRGDATDDEVLTQAGIQRARGLAAVLGTDADNLFVIFSARLVRKDIQILARASDNRQAKKLEKAGADRVVSPYAASATKIAQLLANPHVEDFIEIFAGKGSELDLAEVQVSEETEYAGLSLKDTDFTQRGIVIVAVRKSDDQLLIPPPISTTLDPGDSLIAFGKADAIQSLLSHV